MKEFKQFYIWGMNAKFFMGIYFSAIIFLMSVVNLCFGIETFRIVTILQIFALSIIIAFSQVWILPSSTDFSKSIFFKKSVSWLAMSAVISFLFAYFGSWFEQFGIWGVLIFVPALILGCIAMLVGLHWEQEMDSISLNNSIKKYQDSNKE